MAGFLDPSLFQSALNKNDSSFLGTLQNSKNLFSNVASNAINGTGQAAEGGGFLNFLGSENFANLGKGLGGISNIANIGTSIYGMFQTSRALQMQKEALNEAKRQNAIENERWNKREAERVAANKTISDSARLWNEPLPTERD